MSSDLLSRAIEIAAGAHAGQVDKAGQPYILHPLRVMMSLQDPDERIVAVLHDVLEDTPVTAANLLAAGFSEGHIEAIDSVTRRPDETYQAFVERAGCNRIGKSVKLADIADNLSPARAGSRPPHLTERYTKARAQLLGESAE